MPDLLLRDLDEETKERIRVKAAENGRSQSAEACATLRMAYLPKESAEDSWIMKYYRACQSDGGFSLEQPERHRGRQPDVWWIEGADGFADLDQGLEAQS